MENFQNIGNTEYSTGCTIESKFRVVKILGGQEPNNSARSLLVLDQKMFLGWKSFYSVGGVRKNAFGSI